MLNYLNAKSIFIGLIIIASFSCSKKKDETPQPSSNSALPGNTLTYNGKPGTSIHFESPNGNITMDFVSNTKNYINHTYNISNSYYDSNPTSITESYFREEPNKMFVYYPQYGTEFKAYDLTLPLNTTWSHTVNLSAEVINIFTFKVTAVGLTKTINGLTFKDVIEVESVTQSQYSQSFINQLKYYGMSQSEINVLQQQLAQNTVTGINYMAPGLGSIQSYAANQLVRQVLSYTLAQ